MIDRARRRRGLRGVPARARAVRVGLEARVRGRGLRGDRRRRLRPLRAASSADVYEGFLPARRLRGERFDLNETETAIVGRRSGRTMRLGDPVEVRVDSVEAPRGRVDLVPARASELGADEQARQAQAGLRRRRDQPRASPQVRARREVRGRDRAAPAARSSRCARERLRSATPTRRSRTARSGSATPTSRRTRRRASRTTIPSARGSCSCTATRSSA